jgi:hypothetical protein
MIGKEMAWPKVCQDGAEQGGVFSKAIMIDLVKFLESLSLQLDYNSFVIDD